MLNPRRKPGRRFLVRRPFTLIEPLSTDLTLGLTWTLASRPGRESYPTRRPFYLFDCPRGPFEAYISNTDLPSAAISSPHTA